ncbi:MAG: 16S rRNA (cytosine(1402)-N(4))-methyltransferase RsmH [Acholeplasmataceae bacterium]|nr:16S rRNA (cytosine(1402)-N(4))-methyltransferase RsmH [Acholeplasmataceae bacterium]
MEGLKHIPVLLEEALAGLNIKSNGVYVDCTMGGAGHASKILKRLNQEGYLYCFEQDEASVIRGRKVLEQISNNFTIIQDNFVNIKARLEEHGVHGVDGILYDLGVSSFQFDEQERGFSYNYDARLDMRMNREQEISAYEIVNNTDYEELKSILYKYGEERFAPNIARKICIYREKKPITTTFELVEIIKEAIPAFARRSGGHPAKKVFQALRIAVNDELQVFETSLKEALKLLKPGGRIAVITFHSLEDRICKQVFKSKVETVIPRGLPIKASEIKNEFRLLNNKVIIPTEEEIKSNHRAHSAKLRIIERKEEE